MSTTHDVGHPAACSSGAHRTHLAALLARAAEGDADAFMAFYDLTAAAAYRAAAARCGDRTRATDLTCALYARAWTEVGRYAPSGLSPVAWLLAGLVEADPTRGRRESVADACA